ESLRRRRRARDVRLALHARVRGRRRAARTGDHARDLLAAARPVQPAKRLRRRARVRAAPPRAAVALRVRVRPRVRRPAASRARNSGERDGDPRAHRDEDAGPQRRVGAPVNIATKAFAVWRIAFGAYLAAHFAALVPYGAELFGRDGVLPDARVN